KKLVLSQGVFAAGDRVVVAVSGGPDSMCLLHLLWRLKKTLPIELFAVTLDHGLRKEARRETRVIRSFGEKLGIPVTARAIPVGRHAAAHKLSLETAGRLLRYRALAEAARELRCATIATGHTADDNAETVLMWLIRGTGTEGLSGIPLSRPVEAGVRVVRPLLPVTRPEIMAYAQRQKIPFCIDRSNLSLDFTRNRIRHKVVPLLKEYNPCLVEHLFNLSRIISRENDFISRFVSRALKQSVRRKENTILLDLNMFFKYNKVIQSRVLKEIMPEKRSLVHIERLLGWIFAPAQKEMVLSRSWHVERTKNRVVFRKTPEK
ncbi:MAG: tRNA lysidine(34) synthetase TilS, partial [Endomicrobiales bacterium]